MLTNKLNLQVKKNMEDLQRELDINLIKLPNEPETRYMQD